MVELNWIATTPLSRIYAAGRHGVKESAAGLTMAELSDFELVQVMARRGQWSAVAQACATALHWPRRAITCTSSKSPSSAMVRPAALSSTP